ncbi:ubiquitin-conjugating enzyme E2-binding protein [Aspergillus varians]
MDPDTETGPLGLHAEYLPNIRQVSVQISVPADTHPEISLSESRRAVSVSVSLSEPVGYVSETIKLPARVTEGSRRILRDANVARNGSCTGLGTDIGREFSYRMQVDDAELVQRGAVEELMDNFVPWAAGDMAASTKLRCGQCERVIIDTPDVATSSSLLDEHSALQSASWVWKDLPSGNWAEMMDFWHCHKPDPLEGQDDHGPDKHLVEDENSKVKGYGASNQVLATPGTVLVDVATFLISDIECKGLKKVTKESTDGSLVPSEDELICDGCNTLIGVQDSIAKGWRLFKTSLAASVASSEEGSDEVNVNWQKHPTELVVAAQLLELIERESARRFIIHCGKQDGLLLWVFNPDMRYSNSSSHHSITSQRAMKVFFQNAANVEAMLHPEVGKTSSLSLEELRLPVGTYASFATALEASNKMLPQSARTFKGNWRVGILHRLERRKRT